jgi:uncharacterized protein
MSDNFLQYNAGRIFIGRLSHGEDIIRALKHFCLKNSIKMAAFSVTGAVSLFTIGVFDQKQQVHVTSRNELPMEIISCTGCIAFPGEKAHVKAQIILADQLGKTSGGRLFSDTLLFAGELHLIELLGPPASREYDQDSGRMLLAVNKLKK